MDLFAGFATETVLPFPAIAARLLLAVILGGIVGFEREWRRRPAGLRTHILVCLASAIVAILTIELTRYPGFDEDMVRVDPARLLEAVTQGVAFLAAGIIIFSRGEVHGLTTGAGMWLAAAIGLACGLGFWQLAGLATLLGIIVLALLHVLEVKFAPKIQEEQRQVAAGRGEEGTQE